METIKRTNTIIDNFNLSATFTIEKGHPIRTTMHYINGCLFVLGQTYIARLCPESKEIIWEIDGLEYVNMLVNVDHEVMHLRVGKSLCSMSIESGEILWAADDGKVKEFPLKNIGDYILCRNENESGKQLICRHKSDGRIAWKSDVFESSFSEVLTCEKSPNIAVIKARDIFSKESWYYCFNIETGDTVWEYNCNELAISQYSGFDKNASGFSFAKVYGGRLYYGLTPGLIFAVDFNTGEHIWTYHKDTPLTPYCFIEKSGRLYFNVNQSNTRNNFLGCLDANTGKEIFITENFSPEGCGVINLFGKYILGGQGPYLAFYDTEQEEFVYLYKDPEKRDIFGGVFCQHKDQLILKSGKTIYWFDAKEIINS